MKRTPNLGQAMEQSIGKAMGRVKRRVGEIIAARDEDKRRVDDNGDGILLQERKSGLTGLSEDLPLELTSIETKGTETLDFYQFGNEISMNKYFYVIEYRYNLPSYFTAQPGERGSDAVNQEHLGGNNEFKNLFAMR